MFGNGKSFGGLIAVGFVSFLLSKDDSALALSAPSDSQMVIKNTSDLVSEFRDCQLCWGHLVPPGASSFTVDGGLVVYDSASFKPTWLKKLSTVTLNGFRAYVLTLSEDKATRNVIVRNERGAQVATIPPPTGYDPTWLALALYPNLGDYPAGVVSDILSWYDPSRIAVSMALMSSKDLAGYEQSLAASAVLPGEQMVIMSMTPPESVDDITMSLGASGPTSQVVEIYVPETFSNRIDIFSSTNLLGLWNIEATGLVPAASMIIWTNIHPANTNFSGGGGGGGGLPPPGEGGGENYTNLFPAQVGFFCAGNGDLSPLTDPDSDGLTSPMETLVLGSSPTNSDTDADGFSDTVEASFATGLNNSNSIPVIGTFSPETVVILTNRTYSDGYTVTLSPMAGCTTDIPSSALQRFGVASVSSTVAQAISCSTSGSNISYSIQSGSAGTTALRANLGTVYYGSQTVHSASAIWNANTVRLGMAPANQVHWHNVSPQFSYAAETNDVGLNVTPELARSYFTMPPSNSNPSVVQYSGDCGGTGIQVQAWSPGTANINILLNGLRGAGFGVDVAEVYFPQQAMAILTNETRDVYLSVDPYDRTTNVWTTNHQPTTVEFTHPTVYSWKAKGLVPGTAYIDAGYGRKPTDRLRIDVLDVMSESTNLVMAVDPSQPAAATYDWTKIRLGSGDTMYDWSWASSLVGASSSSYGIFLPTEPEGVVVAELITNAAVSGVALPYCKLLVKPYQNAGGTAQVVMRTASNEYARVTAHVVKARPFTNILYVAKNGTGQLTLTEANTPRGGWDKITSWAPGPVSNRVTWEQFGDAEYQWIIEKQWCYQNYEGESDLNARYNPTCMVYFCEYAYTNWPWIGWNVDPVLFAPVTYLPTNAPANPGDCVFTLRQVGGSGAVKVIVGSDWHYLGNSNAVVMTDHLVQTIDPTFGSSGAKAWTLPGQVWSDVAGQVDLEYLITNQHGIVASNTISLFVIKVDIIDSLIYTNSFNLSTTKYDIATIPERENTNSWTAKLHGTDARMNVVIKYNRNGTEANVEWVAPSGNLYFTNGAFNMNIVLLDGSNAVPQMVTNGEILEINSVLHGDRIIVELDTTGCRDNLVVVKNFTWNDLQRLGTNNLHLAPQYSSLNVDLQDAIINTIIFCLDRTVPRDQRTQRTDDLMAGLTTSTNYPDFHSTYTNPVLAVLDIPSAVGIGFFPWDHMHFHMMLETNVLPSSLAASKIALENQCTNYWDSDYDEMESDLRPNLLSLLNAACSSTIPLTISHPYDVDLYPQNYVDPVTGVNAVHIADPIRNVKTYLSNKRPILFFAGPELTGAYEKLPPVQVWQTQLFVNRNQQIEIFASSNYRWIVDGEGQIHDACKEE